MKQTFKGNEISCHNKISYTVDKEQPQLDSVAERLKLAEKLKSTGFKIELDGRLQKRK